MTRLSLFLLAICCVIALTLAPPATADDAPTFNEPARAAPVVAFVLGDAIAELADFADDVRVAWHYVVEAWHEQRAAVPSVRRVPATAQAAAPPPTTTAQMVSPATVRPAVLPPAALPSAALPPSVVESGLCPCCKIRPAIECCQAHGRCMYTPTAVP